MIFLYIYRRKKNIANNNNDKQREETRDTITLSPSSSSSSSPDESRRFTKWSCLRKDPETTPSDEESGYNADQRSRDSEGTLVTVDGEKEMEIETLLKASAYILGARGSSIMYKAVLEDGTVYAVRRLGETGLTQRRFKDFESNIRAIGKLVHPNLVRLRGFYWGIDEKLVIYDFVPNGSLVNPRYREFYNVSSFAKIRFFFNNSKIRLSSIVFDEQGKEVGLLRRIIYRGRLGLR